MNLHSLFSYLYGAWQELALGGAVGYALAALKPLSTIIKSMMDYRKGKGRVRAEGKIIPGLADRQSASRHNNHSGINSGQLLELFEVKVRNIGNVPAYVEEVAVLDRDGDRYQAHEISRWSQFLVPIGEEGPKEVPAASYCKFVVRIPFDKDITQLKSWYVSFNNGVQYKVRLLSWRQRWSALMR